MPHATTKASVLIPSKSPQQVFPHIYPPDFSIAPITFRLFQLRGVKVPDGTLENQSKFTLLKQQKNEAVLLGLIGKLWTWSGALQDFQPNEFLQFRNPGFAKATWEFELTQMENGTLLEAETSIFCLSEQALKKFKPYWRMVKPFSAFTRVELLNSVKKQVLESNSRP